MTRSSGTAGSALAALSPKTLILDVYGAQVRSLGGWLQVADLVALMAELGHDERAVRSAVSRMKRAGLLAARSRTGSAGYALTAAAERILEDGDERLFRSAIPAARHEGWVLVVFSVPERSRERRHRLRTQLVRLGFGQLTPGVWIAPSRVRAEAARLLLRSDLAQYVTLFEGEHAGFSDLRQLVARAWDLAAIDGAYRRFIAEQRRLARPGSGKIDGAVAFARHTGLLAAWRRLAYLDPGLPADLLPRSWSGEKARLLFTELHDRLAPRALAHVRALVSSGSARR